jgi:ankyrin repeat protein
MGANPAATDNFGKTPLRLAQGVANGECVELLRKAEAKG